MVEGFHILYLKYLQKKSPACGAFKFYLPIIRTKLISSLWVAIKEKAEKVKITIVRLNCHFVLI